MSLTKQILVIEDNREMRENIQEILELANYQVVTAENGKVGLLKAKEVLPDLIICDIMMPEIDGYEALYLLSKNPTTTNIPFIFLTAKSDRSDWRKGMNMGADDYLTKPFKDMELLEVIETRLKKHESRLSQVSPPPDTSTAQTKSSLISLEGIISQDSKHTSFKKKELIYWEGDHSYHLFFIVSGKVRTFKLNQDAKEYTTGLHKKGDYIGYTSLLNGGEYTESAVALEDTEIVKMHKDDFIASLANNPELSRSFMEMLSGNLVEKGQELINLAYNTVRKRVADGLLTLQNKYHEKEDGFFSIAITRDDLASIAGTSTESVIRVLSDFKSEKLIAVRGSRITILETETLEKLKY